MRNNISHSYCNVNSAVEVDFEKIKEVRLADKFVVNEWAGARKLWYVALFFEVRYLDGRIFYTEDHLSMRELLSIDNWSLLLFRS